jgi:molecular chaperone HscA
VAVEPSYGLEDADIERMLRDSFEHAREDVHVRALAEARVEGRRLLEATRSALQADGGLLSAAERAAIDDAVQKLDERLSGGDHRAVKQATDALSRATDAFAARRMDEGIRRALAGRKIGSL